MCATYYIAVDEREMAEIIEAVKKNSEVNISTGNVYPKQIMPVIASDKHNANVMPMFWGFPLKGKKSVNFNARSENIYRIPMFRNAYPAVIPTSGFYEWRDEDGIKRKYMFNMPAEPITYIAGLCADFAYLEDGLYPNRFTMITAPPSEEFKKYHQRQPVTLGREDCKIWLKDMPRELLRREPAKLDVIAV